MVQNQLLPRLKEVFLKADQNLKEQRHIVEDINYTLFWMAWSMNKEEVVWWFQSMEQIISYLDILMIEYQEVTKSMAYIMEMVWTTMPTLDQAARAEKPDYDDNYRGISSQTYPKDRFKNWLSKQLDPNLNWPCANQVLQLQHCTQTPNKCCGMPHCEGQECTERNCPNHCC